jgi:uncharacterized protein YajQ (UPF0234 family)
MPSFDIVSKVDMQAMDNAVNITKKEISNRFDFKGAPVEIDSRSMKQGIDAAALDVSKEPYQSGKTVKKEVEVRNGLKQDDAKKIVKLIKDSGLKVQVQIMDDTVRVTGKKIDDLQEVIQLCRGSNLGIPMQYINMR